VQIPVPVPMYRYQLGNHLGSSMLEVDETGLVISYEEYTPYGASAYQAARSGVDVSARRYRYTGKERDEETGLYYNGARYLAAWLGRWTSADPIGIGADGPGLYNYTRGSPVNYTDPSGTETWLEEAWSSAKAKYGEAKEGVADRVDSARNIVGQVKEGVERFQSSKERLPVMERLKRAFTPEVFPLLDMEISDERKQFEPVFRIPREAKRFDKAMTEKDYATATEAFLGIREAAQELEQQAAEIVGGVGGLLKPPVSGGLAPGPRRTVPKKSVTTGAAPRANAGGVAADAQTAAGAAGGQSTVGAMRRLEYEASPKHPVGVKTHSRANPGPRNGQAALDVSVEAGAKRRIGIDYDTGEFVVFDETHPGRSGLGGPPRVFHGHTRPWGDLEHKMQNSLIQAGMVNRKGEIIRGDR